MSKYKFETLQLHVGQEQPDPATDARAVPIYQTTSYVFRDSAHAAARFGLADAGNIYGRLTNSTQDVLEKRIAALEGGVAALALASGAAAITYTIQALAQAGDHIVAQKTIYGGSYNLLAHTLPQFGVQTTFVNAHDLSELEAAIQDICLQNDSIVVVNAAYLLHSALGFDLDLAKHHCHVLSAFFLQPAYRLLQFVVPCANGEDLQILFVCSLFQPQLPAAYLLEL